MDQYNELFIGNSSNLQQMLHNPATNELKVIFKPSKKQIESGEPLPVYVYQNVTDDIVNGLLSAVENGLSIGSLFQKMIVKNPTDFPVEKQ
jgi:hypothetical protein